MKNQKKIKSFPLWGLKGLLSVALIGLGTTAFAQGAEVCRGTGYMIANAVEASAGSEYRWLENGNVLANTNQATYTVPNNKAAGIYTYVRQSKSGDCPDWQSSNEFTVTVFDCTFTIPDPGAGATATFTDPRDGKQYKTVRMPDDRIWFAQNLNYTKDLTFNLYAREANGKQFIGAENGAPAIGSYWCPGAEGPVYSGSPNCNIYGALYTWETAMMVDGKYADESRTSSAWDDAWVLPYYYATGTIGTNPNADRNNARGGTDVKGGGRGICPKGWHIPTVREWAIMLDKVDGDGNGSAFVNTNQQSWTGTDVCLKLKSSGTYNAGNPIQGAWLDSDQRGTDVYQFNLLPLGGRNMGGYFEGYGTNADTQQSSVYGRTISGRSCCTHSLPGALLTYNNARARSSGVRCVAD
ncbi:MAG: hypothetical protein LBT61_02055 [Prevotellaceae bacterium]|jgi:uncharacterized protein (TIGR02145 family)|nr:hypothetical protein [Prevotellaceae bacterium]